MNWPQGRKDRQRSTRGHTGSLGGDTHNSASPIKTCRRGSATWAIYNKLADSREIHLQIHHEVNIGGGAAEM